VTALPAFLKRAWPRRVLLAAALFTLLAFAGLVGFRLLDAWFPFPLASLHPPVATMVTDERGEPLRCFLPPDEQWRFPVRLNEAAPVLKKTLLASEDRHFYRHPGVNPLAILRALLMNIGHLRVVSGGSTITMQVARLADPKPRTVLSKIQEAFRALQLERIYSKRELFEFYLNHTPYGRNIVGVAAAAYFYFGKAPDKLSLGESALLAVIPRAPGRYDPVRNPTAAKAARDGLLDRLEGQGVFPQDEIEAARLQPLPEAIRKPPIIAPHFCELILRQNQEKHGGQAYSRVKTTIDRRVQRVAAEKVLERIGWVRDQGLENVAVVVLESESRKLRAMVGSADFFDMSKHGMINGALIRRSPGSTLKPLLYAKAMDAGLLVPQSMLLDIPTEFAGYSARNYDGQYRGRITVEDALIHSLNVPAVRLLSVLGVPEFYELLKAGGISTLNRPASSYGLPLALGGCEVTLLDLTNLYASLAASGVHRAVALQPESSDPDESRKASRSRFRLQDQDPATGKRILSGEASYLTSRILGKVERSDLPQAWSLTRDAPAVAWKTGTSFGHRDAWAVGFSSKYTIGVWVGNLDGRAVKGISGAKQAGPILFDLFRALESGGAELPRPESLDIEEIEVCAESRQLAGPFCPERIRIEHLPGRTKLQQCALHRQIFVDEETGERLEGDCLSQRPSRPVLVKEYPLELLAWRRNQGQPMDELPPLSPLCATVPSDSPPRIVSPNPKTPYKLRRDAPAAFQRIALTAQAGADVKELFWLVDGRLVAHGPPTSKLFLDPEPGEHRIVVQDEQGRMDAATFRVEE
jgi:penicillin-binding protein 1C